MYEKVLKRRDNFILAAINAEDAGMKALWIKRAEEENRRLNLLGNYSIGLLNK